jgi:hypothetical protein
MLAPLLLLASAPGADYDAVRAEAEARGALVPGDTARLVGLADEVGCLADPDPEDCAAGRVAPPPDDPLIELVPVPALAVPALGGAGPALLLPRFPYGLDEPVTPAFGTVLPQPPAGGWLRLDLPPGAAPPPGPCEVRLLARPAALGVQVLPWRSAPRGAPTEAPSGFPASSTRIWEPPPGPLDRLQVLLPLELVGARVEGGAGVGWAWTDGPAPLADQPLPEPAWIEGSVARMRPAVGLCARALFAEQVRRPRYGPPALPGDLPDPLVFVSLDATGRVADSLALSSPWAALEPNGCLRANLLLLPPAVRGGSLDVLPLAGVTEPARPLPPAP